MVASPASLIARRDLLLLLVQKELKLKYKGAALGLLWSLLNPILMMLVYTAVFSVIVRFAIGRYPIFLLSGLLPWTAFATALTAATSTLVSNGHLIRRVRFPIEFLPITSVLANLVNLLPGLAFLVLLAVYFHQALGWPLLALPLLIALQTVFMIGIAMLLSSIDVYFRDVEYLVGIGLTIWFFMTPILYPLSAVGQGRLRLVLMLNPMTWLVTSYQRVWHDDQWPDLTSLLLFAAAAFVALVVGAATFKRMEGRFAEEV